MNIVQKVLHLDKLSSMLTWNLKAQYKLFLAADSVLALERCSLQLPFACRFAEHYVHEKIKTTTEVNGLTFNINLTRCFI